MSIQAIYLGGVILAFLTFAIVLAGGSIWTKLAPVSKAANLEGGASRPGEPARGAAPQVSAQAARTAPRKPVNA